MFFFFKLGQHVSLLWKVADQDDQIKATPSHLHVVLHLLREVGDVVGVAVHGAVVHLDVDGHRINDGEGSVVLQA